MSDTGLWDLLGDAERASLSRTRAAVSEGTELQIVERGGHGSPVIMLHGIWGWWGYWRSLQAAPDVFAGRPLWMIDLRGHGDSSKPATGYRVDDYATDIVALLDQRGVRECLLIGHSLGALVALEVVRQRPDLFEALVLEDPPMPARSGASEQFRGVYELKHASIDAIAEELRFWQPALSAAQARESAMCLNATADGVFEATFGDAGLVSSAPVAGMELFIPTLVILPDAASQRACRPEGEDLLRRAFSVISIVAIPGTSHTVLRDAPDAYRELIGAFVAERR